MSFTETNNLLTIDEDTELDQFDTTILEEVTAIKNVSDEKTKNLQKRQDKLIENISKLVNSTQSLEEIESLEAIYNSMIPVVSAVRERSKTSFTSINNFHTGSKIVPQRRLFSTKKKRKGKNKELNDSHEMSNIALNLLV